MESIRKTELETRLLALCETTLAPLGLRPVDVDCRIGPRSLVRLFIEGTGRGTATLDECAEASRKLGDVLDAVEGIPGMYDLEVSSPGLDRRLRLASDFQGAVGSDVKLKLVESIPGLGANVAGRLEAVEGGALRVLSQKKEWPIPLAQVVRANVVWQESPATRR